MEERILNRRVAYYLINVKARHNQNPIHYVDAFRSLAQQDPLIGLRGELSASVKHLENGELDNEGLPYWMNLEILTYTIINPEAFYNRRSHQDVAMQWDSDIVANKKEAALYFIPSVHIVAFKKSSKITLNRVHQYLIQALDRIEPNGFDVTIIPDHDEVSRILEAHSIINIDASLTYSNPLGGHSNLFSEAFDDKLQRSRAKIVKMVIQGTKEEPLQVDDDGIINAVVNQAVTGNGTVDATVRLTENAPITHINSSQHPRLIMVEQIVRNVGFTLYNQLRAIFHLN